MNTCLQDMLHDSTIEKRSSQWDRPFQSSRAKMANPVSTWTTVTLLVSVSSTKHEYGKKNRHRCWCLELVHQRCWNQKFIVADCCSSWSHRDYLTLLLNFNEGMSLCSRTDTYLLIDNRAYVGNISQWQLIIKQALIHIVLTVWNIQYSISNLLSQRENRSWNFDFRCQACPLGTGRSTRCSFSWFWGSKVSYYPTHLPKAAVFTSRIAGGNSTHFSSGPHGSKVPDNRAAWSRQWSAKWSETVHWCKFIFLVFLNPSLS